MHFVYTPETKVATMDLQTCLSEALETTIKMRHAQRLPVDLSKPVVVCFKADAASIGMLFYYCHCFSNYSQASSFMNQISSS
jgi:hypothetical protein